MLKLLTYNIHKGFNRFNRKLVVHKIRQKLHQIAPDIVFLQEVHGEHKRHEVRFGDWPEEPQFEFLADQLWPHHAYGKNAIYHHGHHGNAILSKHSFEKWDNINLSRISRSSRSLLHGVIRDPETNGFVHLICVHFEIVGFERRRQLDVLTNYIETSVPDDEPVIVAGDFNDWSGKIGSLLEVQLDMQEAYGAMYGGRAKTFPSHWPILPMDRIYFRGLNLHKCDCLDSFSWRRMSDHLPLYAEFKTVA